MPCLNGERHIRASIESVLTQSFANFELIVVDNGSTDGTWGILSSIEDKRVYVYSQPIRGVSRARNYGLGKAIGEYIAFLDCDDTWNQDFLEKMYAALNNNKEAVLAYCGWHNIGIEGPRGQPFIPPLYETPIKSQVLLEGCRWPIHGCITKRSAIAKAGGFNTQLTIAEDYLLWMEVSNMGEIILVPEVLAQYHHHEGVQVTRNRSLFSLDTLKAKLIFLKRHPELLHKIGHERVNALTWGKLIKEGDSLHWQGDINSARSVYRKALFSGHATPASILRMLPCLLPFAIHRLILIIKYRIDL